MSLILIPAVLCIVNRDNNQVTFVFSVVILIVCPCTITLDIAFLLSLKLILTVICVLLEYLRCNAIEV
jgi:hypothetical protein